MCSDTSKASGSDSLEGRYDALNIGDDSFGIIRMMARLCGFLPSSQRQRWSIGETCTAMERCGSRRTRQSEGRLRHDGRREIMPRT